MAKQAGGLAVAVGREAEIRRAASRPDDRFQRFEVGQAGGGGFAAGEKHGPAVVADVGAEQGGAIRSEEGIDVFTKDHQVVLREFGGIIRKDRMVGFLVAMAAGIDAEVALFREAVDGADLHVGLLAEQLGEELAVPVGCAFDEEDAGFRVEDADIEGGTVVRGAGLVGEHRGIDGPAGGGGRSLDFERGGNGFSGPDFKGEAGDFLAGFVAEGNDWPERVEAGRLEGEGDAERLTGEGCEGGARLDQREVGRRGAGPDGDRMDGHVAAAGAESEGFEVTGAGVGGLATIAEDEDAGEGFAAGGGVLQHLRDGGQDE